jgi:CelD/BcsL family acetyltransferase involved in cellulose biosynthesis
MAVVTLLRCRRDISEIEQMWARLHRSACNTNAFVHPAWCLSWLECNPEAQARIVVEHAPDGELRALAAFAAGGSRGRRWTTLGAPLVDFGYPLTAVGLDEAAALARLLEKHESEWGSVTLLGVEASLSDALVARRDAGVRFTIAGTESCPCIDLPSYEVWVNELPRGRWKRLAAVRRRVEKYPGVAFKIIDDPTEIRRAVGSFDALRLQSWWNRNRLRELAPAVRSAGHHAFLRRAAERMAAENAASVVELRAHDRLLASAVLFWTSTNVLVALKATDTRMGSALSPGLALDLFTIELATRRGVTRFEFGRGDETYKYLLGARPRMTNRVVAVKPGSRAPLVRDAARHRLAEASYTWRTRRRRHDARSHFSTPRGCGAAHAWRDERIDPMSGLTFSSVSGMRTTDRRAVTVLEIG